MKRTDYLDIAAGLSQAQVAALRDPNQGGDYDVRMSLAKPVSNWRGPLLERRLIGRKVSFERTEIGQHILEALDRSVKSS